MKQKVIPTIILLLILFVVFFQIFIKFYNTEKKNSNIQVEAYNVVCGTYKRGEVKINSKTLLVDIADDDCKRILGLSNKTSLGGEGMVFVFENSGNHGFWMKDMRFPIDILWIDEFFTIVGIEKNVSPDTYPKPFGQKYLSKYVLETSVGYSNKYNIKIGDKIILNHF